MRRCTQGIGPNGAIQHPGGHTRRSQQKFPIGSSRTVSHPQPARAHKQPPSTVFSFGAQNRDKAGPSIGCCLGHMTGRCVDGLNLDTSNPRCNLSKIGTGSWIDFGSKQLRQHSQHSALGPNLLRTTLVENIILPHSFLAMKLRTAALRLSVGFKWVQRFNANGNSLKSHGVSSRTPSCPATSRIAFRELALCILLRSFASSYSQV